MAGWRLFGLDARVIRNRPRPREIVAYGVLHVLIGDEAVNASHGGAVGGGLDLPFLQHPFDAVDRQAGRADEEREYGRSNQSDIASLIRKQPVEQRGEKLL